MPLSRASRSTPTSATPSLPDSLAAQRATFLTAVARHTPGTDLPRYTEVLDALLAWAAARPGRVAPCTDVSASGVISFTPAPGTVGPRWSMRPVSNAAPVVEVIPAPGPQQEAQRERVRATINEHSRAALGSEDRLRIGFGALKNPAARAALLALLDSLLADSTKMSA